MERLLQSLQEGEVHIWTTHPDALLESVCLPAYEALMSSDEHERHQRYLFARHRHDFLVTRALVRTTLSRYLPVAPQDWAFALNQHGRPEIAAGLPGAGLVRFNISHTDGLIVCLVNWQCDVGIDVEHDQRVKSPLQLATHFFSPQEVRGLSGLEGELAQRDRFFSYWTLKEALIKAKGMGLALPLHQFSFDLERPGLVAVTFDSALGEDAGLWQFAQWRAATHIQMAVAIRHQVVSRILVFRIFQTVPLTTAYDTLDYPLLAQSQN